MGSIATLAVLVTTVLSVCFLLLQARPCELSGRVSEDGRLTTRPHRTKEGLQGLALGLLFYAVIGTAFLIGWAIAGGGFGEWDPGTVECDRPLSSWSVSRWPGPFGRSSRHSTHASDRAHSGMRVHSGWDHSWVDAHQVDQSGAVAMAMLDVKGERLVGPSGRPSPVEHLANVDGSAETISTPWKPIRS